MSFSSMYTSTATPQGVTRASKRMRRLLSIPEAAAELGVPPGSLRTQ